MKITEIVWVAGKKYIFNGATYTVNTLASNLDNENGLIRITDNYSLRQLATMEFIEIKEPTEDEKTLVSFIDEKLKWIATDKNGHIWAYETLPERGISSWEMTKDNNAANLIHFKNAITTTWEDEPLYIGNVERRKR